IGRSSGSTRARTASASAAASRSRRHGSRPCPTSASASRTPRRKRTGSRMDPRARRGGAILFGTAAAVFLADRLTKVWAERVLAGHPIDVIGGVLTLRFTTNSGGAFSLGQSAPWFFAAATLVVSALIVLTAFRARSVLTSVGLGLILGGAL